MIPSHWAASLIVLVALPFFEAKAMNEYDYVLQIAQYIDKNGFVKPQKNWDSSGNGILYSAVDFSLMDTHGFNNSIEQLTPYYLSDIVNCMKVPGLLNRTPNGSFGQEQFDDYLGLALASLVIGTKLLPKTILKYAITHGFVMNNDDKLEFKDWLGRYPHLWMLMASATYTPLKWIFAPVLLGVALLQNPKADDTSGVEIQYTYQSSIRKLFNTSFFFKVWDKKLRKVFKNGMTDVFAVYMSPEHPFTQITKDGKY